MAALSALSLYRSARNTRFRIKHTTNIRHQDQLIEEMGMRKFILLWWQGDNERNEDKWETSHLKQWPHWRKQSPSWLAFCFCIGDRLWKQKDQTPLLEWKKQSRPKISPKGTMKTVRQKRKAALTRQMPSLAASAPKNHISPQKF